jgi:hypothetical protein
VNAKKEQEDRMFLRQYTFQYDDDRFFKGAFDPVARSSLMIELQAHRKRSMTGFYVAFIVGILYGLAGLISPKPPHLLGSAFFLFWAMMLLVFSFHADAKYKLLKAVETMEQGQQ